MKYFLVYIDILGFEKLAEKNAGGQFLEAEEVRNAYRERIESRLKNLEQKDVIKHFKNES